MQKVTDFYKVLEVDEDADLDQIRAQYRKKVREVNESVGSDVVAAGNALRLLTNAYNALRNPARPRDKQ